MKLQPTTYLKIAHLLAFLTGIYCHGLYTGQDPMQFLEKAFFICAYIASYLLMKKGVA